ncbi:MAG: terpene cyclase/mutase family protein [Phycisphaeraceae bacterium]|nr:terpene cyclase/mutase family protein [Phycisphaeraceae bacterium]
MKHRPTLFVLAALAWASLAGLSVSGAEQVPLPTSQTQANVAITRGINYLLSIQLPNGAITDSPKNNSTAFTSLSIMAMLSVGHLPTDQTREGEALRKALALVLDPSRQDKSGYFGKADKSGMEGHGITTLMLTEVLGMGVNDDQDELIRTRCQKAIDLILRSQQHPKKDPSFRGGWRNTPTAKDADLSITIWQVMALRSAKNAGFDVPKEAIDDAVAYIKRSFVRRSRGNKEAACFTYQPKVERGAFAMTAAGIVALSLCGEQDSIEVRDATKWLTTAPVDPTAWYYHGTYYFAQAMTQRDGNMEAQGRQRVEDLLLTRQSPDGFWDHTSTDNEYATVGIGGRVHCTSLAVMSLGVRYHFLPVYQR